jgi:deoxyribonuclease-4
MKKINSLIFGTAGIPLSTSKRNSIDGVSQVRKLGLGAMEVEFVRGVNMSEELALEVGKKAKEEDVVLTSHAPYYINLNASEKQKIHASINRILQTARRAKAFGGYSITFHPAYYMKVDKEKVYNEVMTHMKTIVKTLQDEGNDVWIRPETTGKGTQFGHVDELIKMSSELDQVLPCVDFAHLHARSNGSYNTYEELKKVMESMEKHLGKNALKNMHVHMSGIAYGEKGEKHHLFLKDSDMNYKAVMKVLKEFNCKGVVISESPNIEKDAMLMKKTFENL